VSDQHAETLKYEATEIERLEAELAKSKRINTNLNEDHRYLSEKFAAITARVAKTREISLETWSDRVDFLRALAIESVTLKPTDNSESATVEDIAAFVERFAEVSYPRDVFPPIPEELRARDGVAVDILRRMYPLLASAIRSEFGVAAMPASVIVDPEC